MEDSRHYHDESGTRLGEMYSGFKPHNFNYPKKKCPYCGRKLAYSRINAVDGDGEMDFLYEDMVSCRSRFCRFGTEYGGEVYTTRLSQKRYYDKISWDNCDL